MSIFILTTVWLMVNVAIALPAGRESSQTPLRFTDEGTFQISIFEDLHFGESMKAVTIEVFAYTQQMLGTAGDQNKMLIPSR